MAHGLQIMQNCEAFALALRERAPDAQVTLWCAQRAPLPGADITDAQQRDPWAYYGVARVFGLRRLPCLDLTHVLTGRLGLLASYLQVVSLTLAVCVAALFTHADLYYSRDDLILLPLSFFRPRARLVYEAHHLKASRRGRWLQRQTLRRVAHVVAVTPPLAEELAQLQGDLPPSQRAAILVAHDGIRAERFAALPAQAEARQAVGWPADAFIVGYVGRLHTLGMAKGVDTLIAALARLHDRAGDPASVPTLALVGGPDDIAAQYRQQWLDAGLPAERFLYAGQVQADRVPLYLSAFDVCAMPFPWTQHFAFYASPIKLFEYMASGRALVATALPSYADVVADGESALLVPPSDADALAGAIDRLRADPALRARLAAAAQARVRTGYTWAARARAILDFAIPARSG